VLAIATDKSDIHAKLESVEEGLKELSDIQTEMKKEWDEYIQSRKRLVREVDAMLNKTEESIEKTRNT
jgi:sugar-specific transcriptional regulator TrmB